MKLQISLSKNSRSELKEVLLKAQTSIDGRRLCMNAKTGVLVPARFYVKRRGQAGELKKPTQRANQSQEQLDYVKSYNLLTAMVAHLEIEYAMADKSTVTKHWLRETVHKYRFGKTVYTKATFVEHCQAYLNHLDASRNSESTKEQYKALFSAIDRYITYVNTTQKGRRGFAFDVDELTPEGLSNLREYWRNEYNLSLEHPMHYARYKGKNTIRRKGENAIVKYLKMLRTFFNWLRKTDRTGNDPFMKFDNWTTQTYGTPTFLTIEEVYHLASAELPKTLARHRDVFVFQCHVGCRVSDLTTLTEDKVVDGLLTYAPIKTRRHGTIARVGLDPDAMGLIEKYRGNKRGILLPCTGMEVYNRTLKKVFEAAGMTRKVAVRDSITGDTLYLPLSEVVTSHMARRTFIANYANEGVEISLIKSMSGHKHDGSSIWRYTQYSDELIRDTCMKVWTAWQRRVKNGKKVQKGVKPPGA